MDQFNSDTENTISSMIDEVEGGASNTADQTTPQEPQAQPTQPGLSQVGGNKPVAEQRTQPQPTEAPPTGQQQPPRPTGRLRPDDKGNLVDDAGNIIVNSGIERRMFNALQKEREQNARMQQELATLRDKNLTAQAFNGVPAKLGLTDQQVVVALNMAAAFQKDPVGTLRNLVAEAKALGHNVDDLVGAPGSLDMAAIKRMLDQQLGPLQQDREEQQRRAEVEREAETQYHRFISTHEFADIHRDVLARMWQQELQTSPGVSVETVYWKLRSWAIANGLDFSKPLQEQVVSRQRVQQPQQQQTHTIPPNMQGRAPSPIVQQKQPKQASVDSSWDDVVREAMRESGYQR